MEQFQVNDIVKLKGSSSHQRITKVSHHGISTRYLGSDHGYYDRQSSDFQLVKPKPKSKSRKKEEPKMTRSTLYQTKEETPRYGTLLTEDSQGRYVLEMKGSNSVEAFDETEVTEVVPYTVEVEFSGQGSADYLVPETSLKKGDVVVAGIKLGRVTKLGTKSRKALSGSGLLIVGTVALK